MRKGKEKVKKAKVTAVEGDSKQSTLERGGNKYRLQIDFSEEAFSIQRAGKLKGLCHNPSKAEVIRDAIGVLRWAVDEIREGNRILVEKKKGGEVKEIVFHFIKRPVAEKNVTN